MAFQALYAFIKHPNRSARQVNFSVLKLMFVSFMISCVYVGMMGLICMGSIFDSTSFLYVSTLIFGIAAPIDCTASLILSVIVFVRILKYRIRRSHVGRRWSKRVKPVETQ